MTNGVCKWFNKEKGYGFLKPDNGGNDVFVHMTALNEANISELSEGDRVAFETKESRKAGKLEATKLKLL